MKSRIMGNRLQGKEFLISYYLAENFEMEQMRFNMYHPDNVYHEIPTLIFRFSKVYGDGIYDEFKNCIEKFKGNLEWEVLSRFGAKSIINSSLAPKEEIERQKKAIEQHVISQ